jgi:hypothetical protein
MYPVKTYKTNVDGYVSVKLDELRDLDALEARSRPEDMLWWPRLR